MLLTSELVANAVVHGVPPLELTAFAVDGGVRVEVADAGEAALVVRAPDLDGVGGRGLYLVDALATRWGSIEREPGKVVWFELDVSARPAPEPVPSSCWSVRA